MSTIWDCPIFIVCSSHLPCVLPTNSKIFCAAFYQKSCILSAPKNWRHKKAALNCAAFSRQAKAGTNFLSIPNLARFLALQKSCASKPGWYKSSRISSSPSNGGLRLARYPGYIP